MLGFTQPLTFTDDPKFEELRRKSRIELDALIMHEVDSRVAMPEGAVIPIDQPVIELAAGFNNLPHCYTYQTCYGHFIDDCFFIPEQHKKILSDPQMKDIRLPYREAYWWVVLQNSDLGRMMYQDLEAIARLDLAYMQFGSCGRARLGVPNNYVLQLEPERNKTGEIINLPLAEALHIEQLRARMFEELFKVLRKHQGLCNQVT